MQPWAEPDSGPTPAGSRRAGPRVGVLRPEPPTRSAHQLQPLATFEIVDHATAFWRRRVGVVVAVTLVATLPVQLLSALVCRSQGACAGLRPSVWGAASQLDGDAGDVLVVLALTLLGALAGQVAATAVAHLVTAERMGHDLAPGPALRLAGRDALRVSAAWLLGHLLWLVSAVTLVGPFVVTALLLVVTPAIAIERLGPVAGLRRSWRLGRTRFWPVLGVAVASGFVATLLGLAFAALPLAFSLGGATDRWSWLFAAAATQLQVVVAVPLTAAAATLAYLDLRVRAEGLDLQVDIAAAFVPPPSEGPVGAAAR